MSFVFLTAVQRRNLNEHRSKLIWFVLCNVTGMLAGFHWLWNRFKRPIEENQEKHRHAAGSRYRETEKAASQGDEADQEHRQKGGRKRHGVANDPQLGFCGVRDD